MTLQEVASEQLTAQGTNLVLWTGVVLTVGGLVLLVWPKAEKSEDGKWLLILAGVFLLIGGLALLGYVLLHPATSG